MKYPQLITSTAARGLLISALFVVMGCAQINRPTASQSPYSLEVGPMAHAQIMRLETQVTTDGVILSGILRNQMRRNQPPSGYLDVEILATDNTPTKHIEIPLTRLSIQHVNDGHRFKALLPETPPMGSTLRVRYHDGRPHAFPEEAHDVQR